MGLVCACCCLLAAPLARAQINGVIQDDGSGSYLSYANIQVLDKTSGTTADEQGRFSLPDMDSNATLIISATGYETLRAKASNNCTLKLQRVYTELQDVTVSSNRKGVVLKTGTYKKSDVGMHFSANGIPWILLRYFPYDKSYEHTRFLKSVMIETHSEIKDAVFNIKLYRRGSDGLPGEFLYEQNIIGHAGKGRKNTIVALSDYNIRMPVEGLYIGIEFLRIPQNEHTVCYTVQGERGKRTASQYEPSVGVLASDSGDHAMIFMKGKWEKMWRNEGSVFNKKYRDKYNLFAMELMLTD